MSFTILVLAAASSFLCRTPSAIDGDTLRCQVKGERLRLAAIDAPDSPTNSRCRPHPKPGAVCDAAWAAASRAHLDQLLARGRVHCRVVDASPGRAGFQKVDPFGRPVVRCKVRGKDVSKAQLAAGMATNWPHRP